MYWFVCFPLMMSIDILIRGWQHFDGMWDYICKQTQQKGLYPTINYVNISGNKK